MAGSMTRWNGGTHVLAKLNPRKRDWLLPQVDITGRRRRRHSSAQVTARTALSSAGLFDLNSNPRKENPMEQITLYYRHGSSDKMYQASLQPADGGFIVPFAFGRRGTTL